LNNFVVIYLLPKSGGTLRSKKRIFGAVFLWVITVAGLQAQSTMFVNEINGLQTSYALGSISKLTFTSGNLTVHETAGRKDTYPVSNIRTLSFATLTNSIPITYTTGDSRFLLYPNPVSDEVLISCTDQDQTIRQIDIIDIQGRIVMRKTMNELIANRTSMNLSGLPDGLYICRLRDNIGVKYMKIIKQPTPG
jgi:hypothetical protein